MLGVVLLAFLPILVSSSGDGNIHLLEEEIAEALKACSFPNDTKVNKRQRRAIEGFDDYSASPRIDGNSKQDVSLYDHERRNTSDLKDQMLVLNATDYDYNGYGAGNTREKFLNSVPRQAIGNGNYSNVNRTKRSDPLLSKDDSDQCLSQCVFANLQVVDTRGIPRETDLWNKVQVSVTSQQSRSALRDQIRACFQELQSEAEDNGCSYSNKLERCLMLGFSTRKTNHSKDNNQSK